MIHRIIAPGSWANFFSYSFGVGGFGGSGKIASLERTHCAQSCAFAPTAMRMATARPSSRSALMALAASYAASWASTVDLFQASGVMPPNVASTSARASSSGAILPEEPRRFFPLLPHRLRLRLRRFPLCLGARFRIYRNRCPMRAR